MGIPVFAGSRLTWVLVWAFVVVAFLVAPSAGLLLAVVVLALACGPWLHRSWLRRRHAHGGHSVEGVDPFSQHRR
jgi:uncharacterized membrane protein